jgi:hypothetical protein
MFGVECWPKSGCLTNITKDITTFLIEKKIGGKIFLIGRHFSYWVLSITIEMSRHISAALM